MSARKQTNSELGAALKEAAKAPHKDELWARLEEIAAAQQRPDEAGELYRSVLRETDKPELVATVGPRAVRFYEEWFGAQADELVEILGRVLEVDPGAEWALRRLSVLYTVKERWSDLLALYDRSLSAIEDVAHRRELLAEAGRVAKDFVGDIDRAIGYLQDLARLSPADAQLAAQLERLLERQGRWKELAAVWQARLPALAPREARALRVRTATVLLDRLEDPAGALAEIAPVLAGGEETTAAVALAERVLRSPAASVDVRRQTLGALHAAYGASGQTGNLVTTLQMALDLAAPSERPGVHRQLAEQLAASGDLAGASEQLVQLTALAPDDVEARGRLRALTQQSGDLATYVRGLDAAAQASPAGSPRVALWLEAARAREELLHDRTAAVADYRRAFAEAKHDPALRLQAARRLADLLGELPDAATSPDERLALLESLGSDAGPAPARGGDRRNLLGEAARLAEERGDIDRAIASWSKLLEVDPGETGALDGLIALLERAQRWEPLIAALRRRVAATAPAAQRPDLVRIAGVQAAELAQPAAAIDTWLEIQKLSGEDEESTQALAQLLALTGRWGELAELLTRVSERDATRLGDTLCRLADACRERLGDPARAGAFYARALQANPAHAGALAGMRALLEVDSCRAAAAETLATAYEATGDWSALVGLVDARLGGAPDDASRARLLIEAAALCERRGEDPASALLLMARALPLVPDDGAVERELARLGGLTREWALVTDALRAAAAVTRDPLRASRLRFVEGQLREGQLGDGIGALEAYRNAFEKDAGRLELREAVVRTSARLGNWPLAAQAALAPGLSRDTLERSLLPLLEALASESGGFEGLSMAGAAVLAGGERPSDPALARDLSVRVARWSVSASDAGAAERTEAALLRAAQQARVARDPAVTAGGEGLSASELQILQGLAATQRQRPGRALCDTLLQISELAPSDLDPLREAATVALGPPVMEPLAGTILARLYDQATRLLRRGQSATGTLPADVAASGAVEEITRLELAKPDRSAWARAVEFLLDATRLPFGRETVRALRGRAVGIATERLRDRRLTLSVLRQMVDDDGQDAEALARLAAVYEEERRLPELMSLRQDELLRTQQLERRLQLRLEMEKIAGALEERGGRLEVLKANLEEQPGHRPTIETLARLLEGRNRHGELVDVLSDQAARLEERGDRPAAARLWEWCAQLLEQPIGDRDRAVAAYARVADLAPRPETFEALGRLLLDSGDPLGATAWLERWQTAAEGPVRTRAALELASAYLRADKRPRAVATLERALLDEPDAVEVRKRLIDQYRQDEAWEPLVRALNAGTLRERDRTITLAYAREAAELARTRLNAPQAALGALERAVQLVPEDAALRSQFADALVAAGELGRARDILEALVRESGRRRSRERASLHQRLAKVERSEGHPEEALAHLEQAAEMDMDSASTLEALAEVSEEKGDLDRAERAYRALLLLVRRGGTGATLSTSEALLRLRQIALGRGQTEKAQDLLDSATADAIASPSEAERLGRALRATGEREVLRAVLDRRLGAASDLDQQAAILAELAELAENEGRDADALSAWMESLEKAPAVATTRTAARRAARAGGVSARFVDALEALAGQKRRAPDGPLSAALLFEAGTAAFEDLVDPARAVDLWDRAVQLGTEGGIPTVGAAFALVRLGESRRDSGTRSKGVKALDRLSRAGAPDDVRAQALFRLAEAQMAVEESRDRGLAALAAALELSGDVERAFAIVRDARVPDSDLPRVLPLYEKVARASKDDRMLLDFFERRAALSGATLAEVREGVELAQTLGEPSRAEGLLRRAVELSRNGTDKKAREWALLELAEVRRATGDIAGAVAALEEARDVADPVRVLRLYQDIAQRALEGGGDPAVAARVYERLWEREPLERRFWEPLLSFYAKLRDRAGFDRVARATAERLFDPAERIVVRMANARFLASIDRRDPALVDRLREVLADDPAHQEAIELLADVYQSTGNEQGLTELLAREIDAARSRQDGPAILSLSLRLGERLLAQGAAGEARDVYRQALEGAPDDPRLLRALAGLLSPQEDARERAALLGRLLEIESGADAGRLAIELGDLWSTLGDEERVRRALETGVARAGGDREVFDRLCEFYRTHNAWDRLAALMGEEVERRASPAERAQLLKEAAALNRNNLGRPREAAELLRRARAFAPEDEALLADLVGSLDAIGESAAAVSELSAALSERPPGSPQTVVLLQARADLHEKGGEYEAAVEDREAAFRAGGDSERPALREALQRWRGHAAERGDATAERRAVLRLYELHSHEGDEATARSVLADWCYRHPEDGESLRTLAALDQAAGRWEAVVESAFRLIEVETGEAQIGAAELLLLACEKLGQSAPAIAGLEAALRAQPEHPFLFEKLMALYEGAGERRKQAALLLWTSERNPDPEARYQVLRQAGEIFLRERDLDNAIAAFQRAIELRPADRELSLLVAEVLIASGKLTEAEGILEALMRKAAKDLSSSELSNLEHKMAQLAEARGDQAGRLDWLRRAFDTNRKNGAVAIELADLSEAAGDLDLAVKALRAVTLLPTVSPALTPAMAFLRQARIAQRSGDRPRAVIFAKRALQEDPRLGDAVEFLREIGERRA